MKKRLVALTLTCALAATALAGCGGSTGGDSTASGDSTAATETSTAATETSTAEGSVYYLNFQAGAGSAVAGSGKSLHRGDGCTGNCCNSSIW